MTVTTARSVSYRGKHPLLIANNLGPQPGPVSWHCVRPCKRALSLERSIVSSKPQLQLAPPQLASARTGLERPPAHRMPFQPCLIVRLTPEAQRTVAEGQVDVGPARHSLVSGKCSTSLQPCVCQSGSAAPELPGNWNASQTQGMSGSI